MINLELENGVIHIPNNADEISFGKGLNCQYVWGHQEHNRDTKLEILDIIYPDKIWRQISPEIIDQIIDNLNYLDYTSINNLEYYPTFKLEGKYYGLHPLKELTVREYLDLEFYLSFDDGPLDELDKICAIIFRPIKRKNNNFKNILKNIVTKIIFKVVKPVVFKSYVIEKYDKHIENSEIFKEKLTYSMGLGALLNYNVYKNQLMDEFPYLYNKKNDIEDPFEEEEKAYLEENKEEIGKNFEEIWGFYHIFNELVPTLSEQELWYDKDIKQLLKYLVYINQKNEMNINKNKNMNNGY